MPHMKARGTRVRLPPPPPFFPVFVGLQGLLPNYCPHFDGRIEYPNSLHLMAV